MTDTICSHKIKLEHLARKAIVYLRQSSERQVTYNKESQILQYAMAERVRALGWKQVEVINRVLRCLGWVETLSSGQLEIELGGEQIDDGLEVTG